MHVLGCEDSTLCIDVLLVHEVDKSFVLVSSLELVSQLIIVHDELSEQIEAVHVELKRSDQSTEAIFCVKV